MATKNKRDSERERLARLCGYCKDAEKTISAWRLEEGEHSTGEDSLLGMLSFVHAAIQDTVNTCAGKHLAFAEVNHWLSEDRAKSEINEGSRFEVLIQNLADDIGKSKALFKDGNDAEAWAFAARSIFLAVQLHDLLKITKQEGLGANELKDKIQKSFASEHGRKAANARYSKTGGVRDKIRETWASGKFSSRDICAEQECECLGVRWRTARDWLKDTPDPNPWPAKNEK
jgi:hypothetical protein